MSVRARRLHGWETYMTNVRRTASLVSVAVALAVLVGFAPNASASADGPTRQEIFQTLNVDEVPADYVVLVDTSGSMNDGGLYGDVRGTLATFFAGLTPADHLAVYTFDDFPTPRYLGPASNPGRALASLPPRPRPPSSGNTDIGAALAAARPPPLRSPPLCSSPMVSTRRRRTRPSPTPRTTRGMR
jgi:hypothetical protein